MMTMLGPVRRRRRHGPDSGAAAVEFAILVPILLLIVFGLINFGRAYNAKISAAQAAREGVRRAALGESPAAVSAAGSGAALVAGLSPTVTMTSPCPTLMPSPAPNVEVDVTVPVAIVGIPFMSTHTLNIKGKAVERCGG